MQKSFNAFTLVAIAAISFIFTLLAFITVQPMVSKQNVEVQPMLLNCISKHSNNSQLSIISDLIQTEWPATNQSSSNVYKSFIHPLHEKWNSLLQKNAISGGEGFSGQLVEQTTFYIEQVQNMVRYKKEHKLNENVLVCEIGFNMGHSAMTYLFGAEGISDEVKVNYLGFSFPHNNHQLIAKLMKETFELSAERFNVLWGDSTQFLPYFIGVSNKTKKLHECDIVIVDGGHQHPVPLIDIKNMRHLANKRHHVLIVDDLQCIRPYCVDVVVAWNKLRDGTDGDKKILKETGCWGNAEKSRGYCWGQYI